MGVSIPVRRVVEPVRAKVECVGGVSKAHCLVVISPAAFLALVDRHVTQPMLEADYAKIGDYDEVTSSSRAVPLVAARWQWLVSQCWFRNSRLSSLASRSRGVQEHVLQVGYEGNDDEKWLKYFPETNELDLTDWLEELKGQADWDVWRDHYIPTATELERRLRVLGEAVRANPCRT